MWKPGQSGNPLGRRPNAELELFRKALAAVEKEKNMSLLEHAVRMSFKSENVLIALLKKILPDKMDVAMKAEITEDEMKFIKNSIREFELANNN